MIGRPEYNDSKKASQNQGQDLIGDCRDLDLGTAHLFIRKPKPTV